MCLATSAPRMRIPSRVTFGWEERVDMATEHDSRRRVVAFLLFLGITCMIVILQAMTFADKIDMLVRRKETTVGTMQALHHPINAVETAPDLHHPINKLTLTYGDLPGYTGWARPAQTSAPWYQVVEPISDGTVGEPWAFLIKCQHKDCKEANALFDLRAYGPAVIPGRIQRRSIQGDTYYEATFLFLDPGRYVVEVVLAFSNVPSLNLFPIKEILSYEGYLLPGLPFTVDVQESYSSDVAAKDTDPTAATEKQRPCGYQDLIESSSTSTLERGRWLIVHRVQDQGAMPEKSEKMASSVSDYQAGLNSLGICMDYTYRHCALSPMSELATSLQSMPEIGKFHFVFIGDSNTRRQHDLFLREFGNINPNAMTLISTNYGLTVVLPEIRDKLQTLKENAHPDQKFFLLFNAGLHDINQLCSQLQIKTRRTYITTPEETFSCVEQYRKVLTELVQLVKEFPFALRVFETTTAGWPKWGNYGLTWPTEVSQVYPHYTQPCGVFNDVAWNIMKDYDIPVMDAYWLTLARPDHREILQEIKISGKLVHAGVEVYNILIRKWISLVLQNIDGRPDGLGWERLE